ncbi:hypothetical protein E2C01_004173 [Portunus trituberculatus]|uniref:Uncharacterized protein n=1 Tax=Portunus trituberculatus TaxID=210409 RepID=A0A5B7CTB5_PORTR|nr:hypothetical protein [Portunus trituberculatus]
MCLQLTPRQTKDNKTGREKTTWTRETRDKDQTKHNLALTPTEPHLSCLTQSPPYTTTTTITTTTTARIGPQVSRIHLVCRVPSVWQRIPPALHPLGAVPVYAGAKRGIKIGKEGKHLNSQSPFHRP